METATRTGTEGSLPGRVFISYSHDSLEHRTRVWNFAKKLRSDGIDAIIDQYEPYPEEGFPLWMETQIDRAEFILVVCTETHLRRVHGREKPDKGHGARWEGHLIYQHVYDSGVRNHKFIPVLFDGGKPAHIPKPLRAFAHYRVETAGGYEDLYRRLSFQPSWLPPPLGQLRTLPPELDDHDRSTPGTPETSVSALLKQLLASRSLADLERCQAKADALLNEYPHNSDVHLVHSQVTQTLERERMQAHEGRPLPRFPLFYGRRTGLNMGPTVTFLLLLLIVILFGGVHRVVEAIRAVTEAITGHRSESGRVFIVSPTDGTVVRLNSTLVIQGRIEGHLSGEEAVYVLHPAGPPYGLPGMFFAHRAIIQRDGTWIARLGEWDYWYYHRTPIPGRLELIAVILDKPLTDSPDKDPWWAIPISDEQVEQIKNKSHVIRIQITP